MAQLTLYCVVFAAVVALACAQLTSLGSGMPLGQQPPQASQGYRNNMFNNPLQMLMMSRYLDMNPFMAMLFGGSLGGMGGMSSFLPWMFWGNLW